MIESIFHIKFSKTLLPLMWPDQTKSSTKLYFDPPTSKVSREVANLNDRKNLHSPVLVDAKSTPC